jgi:hypothetical protein
MNPITRLAVANIRTKQWLSCTLPYTLPDGTTVHVGIKAFGRWVQRLECCGIVSNVPEQKTNKRFAELLDKELEVLFASL